LIDIFIINIKLYHSIVDYCHIYYVNDQTYKWIWSQFSEYEK